MANLLGQDIGLNYKGIITIGSTINQNVSASLQSLTDGDGNLLPIQLATGLVGIVGGTIAYSSGTNTRDLLSQTYTINATGGTNTITGIKVNATETSITGTTHNLMDLQVGGVSRLRYRTEGTSGGLLLAGTGGFAGTYTNPALQFGDNNAGFNLDANRLFVKVNNTFVLNLTSVSAMFGQNMLVGSTTAGAAARLHVRGDGTNPIMRLENFDGTYRQLINYTQQVFNVTNGGIFSIRPNEGTTNNLGVDFVVGTSGNLSYMNIATRYYIGTLGSNNTQSGLAFTHTGYNVTSAFYRFYFQGGTTTITTTSGVTGGITYIDSFVPTSGTAVHNSLNLSPTINQTGGANGITRGIYINPTLTAAADYRALEIVTGISIFAASTSNKASINIPTGINPSAPNDGDIWFDGTDFKVRVGGTTRTIQLV